MTTLTNAIDPKKTRFHALIGYVDGTVLRGSGGLTHIEAMGEAITLAKLCDHEQPIAYVGAGLDHIKPSSQPGHDSV